MKTLAGLPDEWSRFKNVETHVPTLIPGPIPSVLKIVSQDCPQGVRSLAILFP
jgi:hypothetical protein